MFVAPSRRNGPFVVAYDGSSSMLHVVTSLGIPRTEIDALHVVAATVVVPARSRPQPTPTDPPRFLLDVHLGALARRMRLLGLDTAYRNDADDDELVHESVAASRVLLSRDRGLLNRRALRDGAFVRGDRPDDQLADVLDRFAPPLQPWTRCTACNGTLETVAKADVVARLEPGTRRRYDSFARCATCDRVYWRGAHYARLGQVVATAAESLRLRTQQSE